MPARYESPEWMQEARDIQQTLCSLVGNRSWDLIPKGRNRILESKVGYWLYNEPKLAPTEANGYTGYNPDQLTKIRARCEQLTRDFNFAENDIRFAVVFIVVGFDKKEIREGRENLLKDVDNEIRQHCDPEDNWTERSKFEEVQSEKSTLIQADQLNENEVLPVFKCQAATSKEWENCIVVDGWHGRRYASWANFIAEERLPGMCRYCVPVNGVYGSDNDGNVLLDFLKPNADSVGNQIIAAFQKLLKIAQLASAIASFVFPGVGFAFVFGVNLLGAAVEAGFAGRALKDRTDHGQSIDWDDPEARQQWLIISFSAVSLVASTLPAIGNSGKVAALVKSQVPVVRGLGLVFLEAGKASVHVLGVCNEVANLMTIRRRRKLSSADFSRLASSVLAFAHVSISFSEDATEVIQQALTDLLGMTRANILPPSGLSLSEALENQMNSFEDRYALYKRLVADPDSLEARFKWLLVHEQTRFDLYDSTERFTKTVGEINQKLAASNQATTRSWAQADAKLQTAQSQQEHLSDIQKLSKTFKTCFEDMHESTMKTLCVRYSQVLPDHQITSPEDILYGGRPIFGSLSGHQKTRLAQVLGDTLDNRSDLLRLVHAFAVHIKCKGFRRYLKLAELVAKQFYEKRTEILYEFRQRLLNGQTYVQVRKYIGSLLGLESLEGPMIKHADTLAIRYFEGEDRLTAWEGLRKALEAFKEGSSAAVPETHVPELGLLTPDLSAYHFHKHKYFGEFVSGTKLQDDQEYLRFVEGASGCPVNEENVTVFQDGSCTIVTQKGPVQGVSVVIINKFAGDEGYTSGIISTMSYSFPPALKLS